MPQKQFGVKKVLMNSGIYSVTSTLQKAIGFFLIPLYTAYLLPADYGKVGLVVSYTGIVSLLFTLALNGAIDRFYSEYKDDLKKLREFRGTIIVFVLINSTILSLILIAFNKYLAIPFMQGVDFYPYILMGILIIFVTPVYSIYQTMLQREQLSLKYSINSTLNFVINLTLNIVLIVGFKYKATGLLLASLITGTLFFAFSLFSMLKNKMISISLNKKYLKESLAYSVPLLPHLMSATVAPFVSRYFLNKNLEIASLGLFNLAWQFASIIDIVQFSVNSAYIPWFYDIMAKGKDERTKVTMFADYMLRMNCFLSLILALFIKEIIQVMANKTYLISWTILPMIVIAYQVRGIYLFYVNTLFYNKRAVRFIFIATITGNFVSIVLSAILTPIIGLQTPAFVLLAEKIVTTTIVVLMSKKMEPFDFKFGKMIVYVVLLAGTIWVGLFYDYANPLGPIQLNIIGYKFVIIIVMFFVLFRKDLHRLKGITKKIINYRKMKKENI